MCRSFETNSAQQKGEGTQYFYVQLFGFLSQQNDIELGTFRGKNTDLEVSV